MKSLETSSTVPEELDDAATPCRPLRADAQRNRARVLEAAEVVFAAEGLGVPIDVIAQKACVGVGTVYRHFPTKEALFEAIVMARIEAITEDARARLDAEDPAAALFGFLEQMAEQAADKRDLIDALAGAGIEFAVVAADKKLELETVVAQLLERGQHAGQVRAEVTAHELLTLVGASCMATGANDPVAGRRMLQIICDGLRQTSPT